VAKTSNFSATTFAWRKKREKAWGDLLGLTTYEGRQGRRNEASSTRKIGAGVARNWGIDMVKKHMGNQMSKMKCGREQKRDNGERHENTREQWMLGSTFSRTDQIKNSEKKI